jgi:hypothetical protein
MQDCLLSILQTCGFRPRNWTLAKGLDCTRTVPMAHDAVSGSDRYATKGE